jgi:hypothetical protein
MDAMIPIFKPPSNNSISLPRQLILRPNGAGFYTGLSPSSAPNWNCVNEAVASTVDWVKFWNNVYTWDTYAMQDHTTEAGTISSVAVYGVCKREAGEDAVGKFRIRLGGVDQDGTEFAMLASGAWSLFHEVIARPGGGAWSWADIDAMECGFGERSDTWKAGFCCQLYAVVDWI